MAPLWTPDGARVVFSSDRNGPMNLFWKAADGTGQAGPLTTSQNTHAPSSWSADRQSLVFMEVPAVGGNADIGLLSLDDSNQPELLLQSDFAEFYPNVSPDGRWIAFSSDESGQNEVYVRPFPNVDDGRWQVSRDGGLSPVWGPDGQELFYRHGTSLDMMIVAVETEPTFSPGNPEVLFAAPYRAGAFGRARPFDLSPDGERFLMIKEAAPDETDVEPHIVVVENWLEELKARVPVP